MRRKILSIILSFAMVLTMIPTAGITAFADGDQQLDNPQITDGVTTWDCIYFGNYYQSSSDTKEQIKWRVLSVDGNDAFIMADKILDWQKYNSASCSVTWENCTLRSWLNGYDASQNAKGTDYSSDNFIDTAFTEEEQSAIIETEVVNGDNPTYSTDGGNNTNDKIYLPSIEEMLDSAYGFGTDCKYNDARMARNSAYATLQGATTASSDYGKYTGYGDWWLRTPGNSNSKAILGRLMGNIDVYGNGVGNPEGIRPVLHIDLSKSDCYSYAGTVSSDGSITGPSGTYVVSFDKNNSNAAATEWQIVESGEKAVEPAEPYCSDKDFAGWYTDKEGTEEFDFDTPITSDTTLYAQWTACYVTLETSRSPYGKVKFTYEPALHDNNVSGYNKKGTECSVYAEPDSGYVFKEWQYKDGTVASTDQTYTFTRNESGLTLYAIFKEIADISALDITVAESAYTGKNINPAVTIDGLTEGTDFTVTYPEEDTINPGTYTLTVNGIGAYKGSKEVEYTIVKRDISTLEWADIDNCAYTGSEVKPAVTMDGLTEGTDFTVTYPDDSTSIGLKTLTIEGIGNCTGKVTKTYIIADENTKIGTAGDEVGYIYDKGTKTLFIYKTGGDGVMEDYPSAVSSVFYKNGISYNAEKIIVEEGVTVIGSCALCGLNNCTSITLPDTLEKIKWAGFSGAKITEIDIPASVTFIAQESFSDCSSLTEINYKGTMADWENVTCNIADTEILSKICYEGHTHNYVEVSRTEPTCGKAGTVEYECSCGLSYTAEGDPATGNHTYNSENKCTVCGHWKPIAADETSGVCGADITWEYDGETKTLTLTGTGATSYIGASQNSPFRASNFKGECEKIVIGEGITGISGCTFFDFTKVKELVLPSTLTEIGWEEFNGFTSLTTVNMYDNMEKLSCNVFNNSGLTAINFFGTKEQYDAIDKDETNEKLDEVTVHYYSTEPETVSGDCITEGSKIYKCDECDAEYVEVLPVEPSKHHSEETYADVKKATLSEDGIIYNRCVSCNEIISTETVYKVEKCTLSTTKYTYNGKVKSPTLTVRDSKGNVLKKDKDYTVTVPTGRKNVGKYTYKITFKGNYSGTKQVSFVINPATASVKSLTSGTKSLKVTATTKPSSKGASYYQIGYKMKGSSTWKYTTTSASYKTIKSLKKGKYYYVKIRAYKTVNGTKYYGAWSSSKLSKKIK